VPKILFWSFLEEFKVGHHHGVPTAWSGVYPTPVSAPFARWCRSTAWTCRICFPSLDMLLGILSLPTLEFLHITEPLTKSLHEAVLLWLISLPRNSEWKFSTLSRGFLLRWNCGSKLLKSYLDTSRFEPWWFFAWASPSRGCFLILCILAQVIKTWWHCITAFFLHHTMCIRTAPYHKHQHTSVF
jgi:hypothetical protein